MKAEIIAVGTELLLGHTVNSDAAYVARELASLGLDLLHSRVVGDNPERLREAMSEALSRSDIVFTTGGLGPTGDDLTKEAAAAVTNRPLMLHEPSLVKLKEYFGARPMSENQVKQAYMPEGATVFVNDAGTAPGCAIPGGNGGYIILLPGPPAELLPMLENRVRPFLLGLAKSAIHSAMIRVFGIGEGAAAMALAGLLDSANPTVATYAATGEMFCRVTAKAASAHEAEALIAPMVREIRRRLGDVVYGIDVESLESVVVHELINARKTIATAESCTGGLVARRITDQPGASEVFGLGLVTYSNEAKTRLLGVPKDMLAEYGAVSAQVAEAMARNVRELAASDLGIGITGIAGPGGGSLEKPVGLVHIALSFADGLWLRQMRPQGRYLGRQWVRQMAASNALDMARRHLAGLPAEIHSPACLASR